MGSSPTARTIIFMIRIKIFLVSIFLFFFLNAFSQELEEKIEKFLLENPEVILKSLQNFEEKKAKEQEVTNEKIINENLISLEDSSNGLYDGNINSNKIIVKFFDFNCSYCKKAHTDIQKLLKKEDVKIQNHIIESIHGHDAFLIETKQISDIFIKILK